MKAKLITIQFLAQKPADTMLTQYKQGKLSLLKQT